MKYIITSRGYTLLQTGVDRAASLLTAAASIAEDGVVSEEELVKVLGVNRDDAREVLRGLQQLDLIRRTDTVKDTEQSYISRYLDDAKRDYQVAHARGHPR